LLTPPVLAHIEAQYQRHGTYGIFVSRLLPVWRAVVPPFAGIAGLSAPRALIPLALASALWYGVLTVFVATLGTNLDAVVVLLAVSAAYLFRRAGTTPNPAKPTSALVIWGPYRFTRNPMYVGMATLYCGGTLLLNDPWPLAFLPLVMALVQRRVIAREEAYLERKFGDVYRAYKARVRRWI